MLLSFYVSFKESSLWKTRKLDYITVTVSLIVASSFLSTLYPTAQLPFMFPLGMISFPFLSSMDFMEDPFELLGTESYNIQFLTVKIWSLPSMPKSLVSIFSFYMTVNFMGAVLGYWMDKSLNNEPLKRELIDFFFRKGLLTSFLALFIIDLIVFLMRGKEPSGLWVYIHFFSVYYFWVPALIATAIYGLKRNKE